jgi:hypothetical protein
MARAHEPPNGSDHPPQNGIKGKQVAIALFVATTFGIMAILSFPLSRVARLPRPLQAALSPAERLIRPILPWFGNLPGHRAPKVSVAVAPQRTRVGPTVPSRPAGPGGPGSGTPSPPAQPGPAEGAPPTPTGAGPHPAQTLATILLGQLTTILSNGPTRLSPEDARRIQAEISTLRSMGRACLADALCAEQLRLVERVIHKLEAHQSEPHKGKHRHAHRRHGHDKGSSHTSQGNAHGGRGDGHGHRHKPKGNGMAAPPGHSHEGKGSHRKHRKHHKSHHSSRKGNHHKSHHSSRKR